MNKGQKVAWQPEGALCADHSVYGVVLEAPAVDEDGQAWPELVWVEWPDLGADLVEVDRLYPIND